MIALQKANWMLIQLFGISEQLLKTVKITTQNTIVSVMQQSAKKDYNIKIVLGLAYKSQVNFIFR